MKDQNEWSPQLYAAVTAYKNQLQAMRELKHRRQLAQESHEKLSEQDRLEFSEVTQYIVEQESQLDTLRNEPTRVSLSDLPQHIQQGLKDREET